MVHGTEFSDDDLRRERICANCGNRYAIEHYFPGSKQYFEGSYNYLAGCITHCLVCWLGCGPEHKELEGHLLREIGPGLGLGTHLVVMPITRVTLEFPVGFPKHTRIYPPGIANLEMLKILEDDDISRSLAGFQSQASGVDQNALNRHATVAFPYTFEWDALWSMNHKNQLEFLRFLSEQADVNCLDLIRYRLCSIDMADTLPGRAGQLGSNHMMAGVLLYNASRNEGRIIGGDAFSYIITKGLGLPIEDIPYDEFPGDGEVGHLAQYGLGLYSAMLETGNPTVKFAQALALLEFLAEPSTYTKFKDVAKIIARYIAKDNEEYTRLLDRFMELTGKKDPITGEFTGYRTRIMHLGGRIELLVPKLADRLDLFRELDGYIRPVLDHMIAHSELPYDEYLEVRGKMKPFEL
jgi:hypothetical protein